MDILNSGPEWLRTILLACMWFVLGSAVTGTIIWRWTQFGFIDDLTGIPNRKLLKYYLKWVMWRASRTQETFILLYIDLNEFKVVNDEFDKERRHEAGDDLLRMASTRIRGNLKWRDIVARVGGDELVAVLRHINTEEGVAESFSARVASLEALLREPFKIGGRRLKTSASVGYAIYPDHGRTALELRQRADQMMYESKKNKPRTHWEAPIHIIEDERV